MAALSRRGLVTLALVVLAGLAGATAAVAAPGWTPAHAVSPPGLGGGGPGAVLYVGHRDLHQGLYSTAAHAVWESGGIVRAAERPATLGAWAAPVAISPPGGGAAAPRVSGDVAVWQRGVGPDTIVQAAVREDGEWARPRTSPPEGAPRRRRR